MNCFKVGVYKGGACFTVQALLGDLPKEVGVGKACFNAVAYKGDEMRMKKNPLDIQDEIDLEDWGIREIYDIHIMSGIMYLLLPTYNPELEPVWLPNRCMVGFLLDSVGQIHSVVNVVDMNGSEYNDLFSYGSAPGEGISQGGHTKFIPKANSATTGFCISNGRNYYTFSSPSALENKFNTNGHFVMPTNYAKGFLPTGTRGGTTAPARCSQAQTSVDCDESDMVSIAEVAIMDGFSDLVVYPYEEGDHTISMTLGEDYFSGTHLVFRAGAGSKTPIFTVDDVSLFRPGEGELLFNGDFSSGFDNWTVSDSSIWEVVDDKATYTANPSAAHETLSQGVSYFAADDVLSFTLSVKNDTDICLGEDNAECVSYNVEGWTSGGAIGDSGVLNQSLAEDDDIFCTASDGLECDNDDVTYSPYPYISPISRTIGTMTVTSNGVFQGGIAGARGYRKCYSNVVTTVQQYATNGYYNLKWHEGSRGLRFDGRYLCADNGGIKVLDILTDDEFSFSVDSMQSDIHYSIFNGILVVLTYDGTINSTLELIEINPPEE